MLTKVEIWERGAEGRIMLKRVVEGACIGGIHVIFEDEKKYFSGGRSVVRRTV